MLNISAPDLLNYSTKIFQFCQTPIEEAKIVADHLVTANLMGFDSHGVIRIPEYIGYVNKGLIQPGASIKIKKEMSTAATIDCGWNFGQVGALRAMEIAIEKADSNHMATVVTTNCCHAGRIGTYTQLAAERGFVAIALANSLHAGRWVLPWGGQEGRLATNPISFAVPCPGSDPILSDFSTAETAEGKIRVYRNRGEQVPAGWIVDAEGKPTCDPKDFYGPPQGSILPFGGDRGYRGYALSLLVDILGGILAASTSMADRDGNGICFIVIDITAFQSREKFGVLIEEMKGIIKSSPPAEGGKEVVMPGELDFRLKQERLKSGISLDHNTWEAICNTAKGLGIKDSPNYSVT